MFLNFSDTKTIDKSIDHLHKISIYAKLIIMDSDFVEEFDSSSESESGESSDKLKEVVSSATSVPLHHPTNNPLQPYHHVLQHPVNFGFPFPVYEQQGYPSSSPYYFNSDVSSHPQYDSPYISEISCRPTANTPQPQEIEDEQIGIRKQKKRRNRKTVKLSDYDESVRSHAWRIYEKKRLESKLEKCANEEECLQSTPSLEAIKKDLTTYTNPQDESAIPKIVKRIKTQRQKRLREKLQRKQRSEENQKNFELAKNRGAEIDKWLKDQATLFEAEIRHQIFLKDVKKSLSEVVKKREMIEGRLKLLSNLQKLRDIRKKQRINTEPGFSAASTVKSDQEFAKGLSSLNEMLQQGLIQVQEEEKMIRVKMTPVPLDVTTSTSTATRLTQGSCNVPNEDPGSEMEDKKLKRQKKWDKWLRKKTRLSDL